MFGSVETGQDRMVAVAEKLLSEDPVLKTNIEGPVACAVLRSMNAAKGKLIMVSPDIREQSIEIRNLASICRRIITILSENEMLHGLMGLEILLRTNRKGRSMRLLQLSVGREVLERARRLSTQDCESIRSAEEARARVHEDQAEAEIGEGLAEERIQRVA